MRSGIRAAVPLAAVCVAVVVLTSPWAVRAQATAASTGNTQTLATQEAPASSVDGGRYTGPLKEGRFHGKGRMVWPNDATYEGEFADGLFHGKGRSSVAGGAVFEGEFVKGELSGQGEHRGMDGLVYRGSFKAGRYDGKGRLEDGRGTVYEGQFKHNEFHGQGKLESRGDTFEGEFRHGRLNGQGQARYKHGGAYRGAWAHNEYHGRGEYSDKQRGRYVGDFEHGSFTGYGVLTYPGGYRVEGRFADWRPQGMGRMVDGEGTVNEGRLGERGINGPGRIVRKDGTVYEGNVQAGVPEGYGVMRLANGDVYRGRFRYGQYDGEGTLNYAKPRDDGRTADSGVWSYGRLKADEDEQRRRAGQAVEDALYAQPALLDKALSALEPSVPGRINMYLLAVAGDGSQEVFRREVDFVRRQFDTQYGTAGRSVVLVNSRNTAQQLPMASVTSVRKAVDAIAAKMDRENDILFVFMTSHGSRTHEFSLGLRGMDLPGLGAKDLGAMLAASGIRWKVVVVSACYSGGFVGPLKNEYTLVMTAARHDRTSFGCADENDFTYFGRAYFKEALPGSASFQSAFAKADKLIEKWEAEHRESPRSARGSDAGGDDNGEGEDGDESNGDPNQEASRAAQSASAGTRSKAGADSHRSMPQIADSPAIAAHLAAWWKQRTLAQPTAIGVAKPTSITEAKPK